MWQDVEDMYEMLWEIYNKMNEFKWTVRMASTSANKAAVSAERAVSKAEKAMSNLSMLLNRLKESTNLINELKDEISDNTKIVLDLHSKVDEYEVMIDCMEQEYEEKCKEHRTKISSIEALYEEIIKNYSPRYVMKHWVKNKESP